MLAGQASDAETLPLLEAARDADPCCVAHIQDCNKNLIASPVAVHSHPVCLINKVLCSTLWHCQPGSFVFFGVGAAETHIFAAVGTWSGNICNFCQLYARAQLNDCCGLDLHHGARRRRRLRWRNVAPCCALMCAVMPDLAHACAWSKGFDQMLLEQLK
jgi:hypothetical protein